MKKIMRLVIIIIAFINFCAIADTNTLTDRDTGQTIVKEFFNDIHDALSGDLVGRNSSGVPTSGQNLGNGTYRWVIYGSTANFSSNITTSGKILLADGDSSNPAIGFSSDDDGSGTGFFRSAANRIGIAINGNQLGVFRSDSLLLDYPNVGGTSALAVDNNDNTSADSHAVIRAATGGSSGGDPFLRLTVYGGSSYAFGIDNSDSDILKLTNSSAGPSYGTTFFSVTTAGLLTLGDSGTSVQHVINGTLKIQGNNAADITALTVYGGNTTGIVRTSLSNSNSSKIFSTLLDSTANTLSMIATLGTGSKIIMKVDTNGEVWLGNPGSNNNVYAYSGLNILAYNGADVVAYRVDAGNNTGIIRSSMYSNDASKYHTFVLDLTANTLQYALSLGSGGKNYLLVDGTANVRLSSGVTTTSRTDDFLYIPTSAGTPTGVPTSFSGYAPIVIDTSNNKLYFYSGGSWRDAGP